MSTPIQDINSIAAAGQPEQGKDEQKSQAQLDYEEGRGFVERGESALAAVSLHNALRGFEEENNSEGIANAANQLGHACMLRKEYDKALVNYQRAWDICEAKGDHMSLLSISGRLIDVYSGKEDYRKALDICLDMLDTYHRNNDPRGSVQILEKMAGIYLKSGDTGKASDTFRTIASVHANFGHKNIAESYQQKADELTSDGQA